MVVDQNKRIIERITEEGFNQGRIAVFDELATPDAVDHAPPPGFKTGGPEAYKQFVQALRAAFPDLRYTVEHLIAEGDKVASSNRARGTHRGEFLGIPPTGKQVEWTEMHIVRVENGKIVEHWGLADVMGLMQQLGVVQATA